MGQIAIQIGALNRSISAPDQKMTDVLNDVVAATDGPTGGTAAQRADWILGLIKNYLVNLAEQRDRMETIQLVDNSRQRVNLET